MRKALAATALGLAIVVAEGTAVSAQTQNRPRVRVYATNGVVLHGRLVELTSSEVVLATDRGTLTLPLMEVRRIDRVMHGVRNGLIAGALTGFGFGVALSSVSRGDDFGAVFNGVMLAGIGAAFGTAIGAVHDDARRAASVLYSAPGQARTIELPTVIVTAASGGILRRRATEITAPAVHSGVRFPLSPTTSLEVDAMHWSWHTTRQIGAVADESRRTLSVSSNVAWRLGTPTTAATIAIGAGIQRSTLHQSISCVRQCGPLSSGRTFATSFAQTTPLAVIGGGAERAITSRLIGFGSVRLVMSQESGLAAFAGIRVPFGKRPVLIF